ncbi:fimbria/pilus outer membrane usher protein [Enterobacter chengduensis]|uniref:fimbria/pilus outer membrane usher protein n=1 Tax=Enterobacter chengduensis TaxID=2494701 RepID=UPI003B978E1F
MKRSHYLVLSLLWLGGSYPLLASAAQPLFNARLLELDRPIEVDISQFNRPDNLPEGEYQVDIYVNDRFIERRAVRFFRRDPESALAPCFVDVKNTLATFGLKVNAIKQLDTVNAEGCEPVPVLPGAKWSLDSEKLALKASIPQVYLDATARDAISPSRWDPGIDALMLNYDFSTTQTLKSDYDSDDLYYLNLRSGVNIGGWRLRNYSALNAVNSRGNVRSLSTYLQHDIASLRSQAMAGDTWTASDLFDSSQVRGVRLYTDSDMLPDSQNGFAPVVRGVAKTNAVITIRQNGYMIYQSAVPQGPFALTDLNTTSSGGDLDVTIKEEDGSEQHFVQPYASLAILRREGQTDVDISIGQRRDNDRFMPEVMQAQVLHGMAWDGMGYDALWWHAAGRRLQRVCRRYW